MRVCFSIEPPSKRSNVYMHTFSPVQSARPRALKLSQRVLIWSVVSLVFRKKKPPKKRSRRRCTPAQWRQSETGSEQACTRTPFRIMIGINNLIRIQILLQTDRIGSGSSKWRVYTKRFLFFFFECDSALIPIICVHVNAACVAQVERHNVKRIKVGTFHKRRKHRRLSQTFDCPPATSLHFRTRRHPTGAMCKRSEKPWQSFRNGTPAACLPVQSVGARAFARIQLGDMSWY